MKIFAGIKKETFIFDIKDNGSKMEIFRDEIPQNYEFREIGKNRYNLILNGHSYLIQINGNNSHYDIIVCGELFHVHVEDERMRALREVMKKSKSTTGEIEIKAPIPGLVTQLKVKEGDQINSGQGLIVLEAMKMENEIKTIESGKVKKIFVEAGSPVEKDQKLIVITTE